MNIDSKFKRVLPEKNFVQQFQEVFLTIFSIMVVRSQDWPPDFLQIFHVQGIGTLVHTPDSASCN